MLVAPNLSGCERFEHVWAVPEDAVKPKRLTQRHDGQDPLLPRMQQVNDGIIFLAKQLTTANAK